MNILIRADASLAIGAGHVMRCLALADTLRGQGADVTFACRPHPGNLINSVEGRGFRVVSLREAEPPTDDPTSWAGTSPTEDASEVLASVARAARPHWIIIDHYALGADWEATVRASGAKILTIDDSNHRPHDADILLNQNYGALRAIGARHQLLGPKYALLQTRFSQARKTLRARNGTVERILITFGGTDPQGLTLFTLQALETLDATSFSIDVVAGEANPHLAELRRFKSDRHHIDLHVQTTDMPTLMTRADLAIGAGGTTTWERFCLGLPSLVITTADNQDPIARLLARDNLIHYLGTANQIDVEELAEAVSKLIARPDELRRFSRAGMSIVDGKGTNRVTEAITNPDPWDSREHATSGSTNDLEARREAGSEPRPDRS